MGETYPAPQLGHRVKDCTKPEACRQFKRGKCTRGGSRFAKAFLSSLLHSDFYLIFFIFISSTVFPFPKDALKDYNVYLEFLVAF